MAARCPVSGCWPSCVFIFAVVTSCVQAHEEEKVSIAAAASTEDFNNEAHHHHHHHQQQQEWNSSKDATSTYSGGDLSESPVTRSLYVGGDQPRRGRPLELDGGCADVVEKFTSKFANSSNDDRILLGGRSANDLFVTSFPREGCKALR